MLFLYILLYLMWSLLAIAVFASMIVLIYTIVKIINNNY